MSALWPWLLLACAIALATKLSGYLMPARWLSGPRATRVAGTMTVGLLAALVLVNTLADGSRVVMDARVGALLAAIIALRCRAPFLVVVLAGAAAAAALRAWGIG